MSTRLILLCLMLLASSIVFAQTEHCLVNRYAQTALFDSTEISVSQDILYAVAERWPSIVIDSLRMDIYQPDPSIDPLVERPLIVMVHGGAWLAGSRQELAYHCMEMARRGFVTATITYRLGWDCPATDVLAICGQCSAQQAKIKNALYRAVQDQRAALRYMVSEADTYGIDTDYIFVQGESAGSFTTLNSTFWDQEEANTFCPWCPEEMGGLDDSGNDLTETYEIKGVVNNCGGIASNLDNVNDQDIPVIGFHDEWDCVAPYGAANVLNCFGCTSFFYSFGSNSLSARLGQNGVCNRMNRKLASLNHCSYPANALIRKSACFLKSIMCEDCSSDITTEIWNVPDCTAGAIPDGVEEWEALEVQLYPNPAYDQIEVKAKESFVEQIAIKIIGLDGRLEWEGQLSTQRETLDISSLSPGLKTIIFYTEGRAPDSLRFIKID